MMQHDTHMAGFNARAYDAWASSYDTCPNPMIAAEELGFPGLYAHVRNKRVLDIGCGTGRHTRRLCALGNTVTGIDPSAGMLDVARRLASADFVTGDFMRHEMTGPKFHAAVAGLVLEHIGDLDGFFHRVAGVLVSGGELFVSNIHPWRAKRGGTAPFWEASTNAEVALKSAAHSDADVARAARAAGFECLRDVSMEADLEMARRRPEWAKFVGQPMVRLWAWRWVPAPPGRCFAG